MTYQYYTDRRLNLDYFRIGTLPNYKNPGAQALGVQVDIEAIVTTG